MMGGDFDSDHSSFAAGTGDSSSSSYRLNAIRTTTMNGIRNVHCWNQCKCSDSGKASIAGLYRNRIKVSAIQIKKTLNLVSHGMTVTKNVKNNTRMLATVAASQRERNIVAVMVFRF